MGEIEDDPSPRRAHVKRFDSVLEIVKGAGWRSEVEDVIKWARIKWHADVMAQKRKTLIALQMLNILEAAGEKIVDTDHRIAPCYQSVT
jgi:hypothetical protein